MRRYSWVTFTLLCLSCDNGSNDKICLPSATQPCVCPGGGQGARVCDPEGKAWGQCLCPVKPDSGVDAPRPDVVTADAPRAAGTEGGPCYPNKTCNAGLTCLSGLCVRLPDAGKPDGATDKGQADKGPGVTITWSANVLDTDHAGKHLSLAASSALLGISYYRELQQPVTVYCPPSGTTPGGNKARPASDLLYLHYDGSTWGTPVKVDQTFGTTYGTSVAFDKATKKVFVGYLGGAAMSSLECASNDAVIASSTSYANFTKRTVSSAGAYAGDTVGYWTSVAVDSKGVDHAAHKDVLFGYYEADGKLKASPMYDNEVVGGVTGSQFTKGGGDYMSLVFDSLDQPVIAFFNPVQIGASGGIQVATKKGTTWSLQQVVSGATSERPSLATNGKGLFAISFYDPAAQVLRYTESAANLTGWVQTVVDPNLTHNGEFSSLAFDSKGQPAIAYYKCGKYNSPTCDPSLDALKFAWRLNNTWYTWEVDTGGLNRCGTYAWLAFTGNDQPVIAYQCVSLDSKTNQFVDSLKVARGVVQ